jgi:hypothetical protein
VRWLVASLGVACLGGLGACALFASDPPANVCVSDQDCFRAQGEICNLDTKRCEPGPDGGVVDAAIDAAPDAP